MRLHLAVTLFTAISSGIASRAALAQDVCDLLQRQTQAFSEAGQRGDGAGMAGMLDSDVIFFNETGERTTRSDMASATPPAAGTPPLAIKTTDWDCKAHGDVAVSSFIDVVEQGKPGERKFRSVESWKKEAAGWKMIGSETLTLPEDPDAVVLDGKTLDEYVGTYEASPQLKFIFTHKGDQLMASLNGGPETEQKAQVRDIFFTPGHGTTPKVFQRGDDGRIIDFIYLRGKNSLVFKRVG